MANLTKVSVSLSSVEPPQNDTIVGLKAGEAIALGDLCYIKSDGKVWRSNGTSVNAAAKVVGIAPRACPVGGAVTLYRNVEFNYGSGLTTGAQLYASATAGAISDAATTGGTAPIGFVVDATRIYVHGSYY